MSSEQQDPSPNETIDVVNTGIEPSPERPKKPWGAIAGAGAVATALVVGAIAITSGGSDSDTATDTASAVQESAETDESTDDVDTPDAQDASAADSVEIPETTVPPADEFFEEAMAVEFGGGGSSPAVFDGERFVTLAMNQDGWVLRSSTDGLEWDERPTTGIPLDGYASSLDFSDGTYVAFGDGYDEETGPNSWAAISTDGVVWSLADLPPGGENSSVVGSVIANGELVVVRTEYNDSFGDEFELLVELGILEEDAYESYCGFDQFEPGSEITLFICNYDEPIDEEQFDDFGPSEEEIQALSDAYDAATTDEERAAIEQELELLWGDPYIGEETVTIEAGDPGFDDLTKILEAQNDQSMPMTTITGPLAGPFAVVDEFVAEGYSNGLAATDSGVFLSIDTYDEESFESRSTVMSWTGSDWVEVGSLPDGLSGQLHGFDDLLLFSGSNQFGQSQAYVSSDGSSWTESSLNSEINGGYTQFISGEAGVVAVIMGYEGDGFPGGPSSEQVTIEKDGFALELSVFTGEATLTDVNGAVIYELDELWEPTPDSEIARLNPISGAITFLDPETGEDLVVITNDDINEAFGYDDFIEEDYVEPNQLTEVQFTADGASWVKLDVAEFATLSPNTSVTPLAVGDDEVVFSLHTYGEIPNELLEFEFEGREPTSDELAALEEFENAPFDDNTYIRVPLG